MTLKDDFKKIVFLFGAGASKDAGCKLSSEMMTSLKNEVNNIAPTQTKFNAFREDFDEIYNFISASLSYQATLKGHVTNTSNYINIEDFVMILRQLIDKEFVIPYPLIGNWNDKIIKWELRNGKIFELFKEFITSLLVIDWTQFDEVKSRTILKPVRALLNHSEDIKLNFFSLNYDLTFENTFNTETTKILDNGFSEKTISENKIRFWAKDFNDINSSTQINLYKLHGSLDWEYDLETEEISIKENVNDGREPLIIFGSSAKMLSFDPFLYILSTFRTSLEEATIFVVVGYSFHDKYINNLLIQQLSQNTAEDNPKKLLVVDPCRSGQSEADFAEELKIIQDSKSINDIINFRQISPERIKLINKTATQFYLEFFADGAKLLREELELTEQGDKPFSD